MTSYKICISKWEKRLTKAKKQYESYKDIWSHAPKYKEQIEIYSEIIKDLKRLMPK